MLSNEKRPKYVPAKIRELLVNALQSHFVNKDVLDVKLGSVDGSLASTLSRMVREDDVDETV